MTQHKPRKRLNAKQILWLFCMGTLAASIIYAFVQFLHAPASAAEALPHQRLKSDYLLMLLQCALGMMVLFLPSAIERRFHIDIPNLLECLYFLFLYCAIYLGEVRNFYFVIPCWDLILHTFSGAMLGVLGFTLVDLLNRSGKVQVSLSPLFVALFAFCFALAVGGIWEIYEFLMDGIFGMNMQKFMLENGTLLAGRAALADTMEDIIVDTIGALAVCIAGYLSLRRKARQNNAEQQTIPSV